MKMGVKILAGLAAIVNVPALALDVTLKQNAGVDYTYSDTADTRIEWSSSSKTYNHGGSPDLVVGHGSPAGIDGGHYSVSLIKFDLTPLLDLAPNGVKSVESATLRVYQVSGLDRTKNAQQMTQDWEEGSGDGNYGTFYDGAACYQAWQGTAMAKEELIATNHNATTIYYYRIADLAIDPTDGDSRFVRRDNNTSGNFRGWDIANRDTTEAADLDELVTYAGTADVYWYDDAGDVIYFRRNAYGYRLWQHDDVWIDSLWDGNATEGPRSSSYDASTAADDTTDPNPAEGWYEIPVQAAVSNWLVMGQANYGLRLVTTPTYTGNNVMASSDRTEKRDPVNAVWEGDPAYDPSEGIDVQPELVISFTPQPPAATVIMVR